MVPRQEWWRPGESQMHSDGDSGAFRRTRSSFALPTSSGPSNELSALPSFGWLVRKRRSIYRLSSQLYFLMRKSTSFMKRLGSWLQLIVSLIYQGPSESTTLPDTTIFDEPMTTGELAMLP